MDDFLARYLTAQLTSAPPAQQPEKSAAKEYTDAYFAAGGGVLREKKASAAPYNDILMQEARKYGASKARSERSSHRTMNRADAQRRAQAQVVSETAKDKKGGMLGGTVRGWLGGQVGAAESGLELLQAADWAASQEKASIDASRRNIENYTAKRDAAQTAEERARWQQLIDRNERLIAINNEAYAKKTADVESAVGKLGNTRAKLKSDAEYGIAKEKEGLGAVGRTAVDAGVAGGQMAMDALAGGLLSIASRVFGDSTQEAKETISPDATTAERMEGKTKALAYGAGSAAVSVGTEKLTNIAAPFKKAFGSGVFDKAIDGALAKMNGSAAGKAALKAAGSFASEGLEEVVEDVLQPILQKATYDENALSQYKDTDYWTNVLYDGLIGGILGLAGSGAEIAGNAVTRRESTKFSPQEGAEATQANGEGNLTPDAQNAPQGAQSALNENGLASLTEREKENLSSGKKNKVVSTFQDAVDFVRRALSDKTNVDRAYLGKVPANTAQMVLRETGVNIDGMGVMMNGVDVRHIIKEHGDPLREQARGQIHVTQEDIARIPEIIAKPDKVSLSPETDSKGRQALVFEKSFGDKYITIQGVSNGKNLLQTDTMYIQKGKARKTQYAMPSAQISAAPAINAQDGLPQSLSNSDATVPQNAAGVNTQDMRSAREYAPERHIDNRTSESVSARGVNAFQFDHPEMKPYFTEAAEQLSGIAGMSLHYGQQMGGRERTADGYRRASYIFETPALRQAMNEGLTRNQIIDAADRLIRDHGQENVKAAKVLEIVLDDMLTNGYTAADGSTVAPNEAYIAAKNAIEGARPAAETAREELPIWDMGDGLGGANRGSLNSDYDNLQAQSGEFYPKGANAARPVDMPTRDFQGNPVSKSASTAMGAEAIPAEVVPFIEQMVADGQLSYRTETDRRALDRADTAIRSKGFDGAMEKYRSDVKRGVVSKDTVVLGQKLLNNAANAGNANAVAEILSLYSTVSVNAGQAMQAMSILRKMSPETQLYGIQRVVDDLNENIKGVSKAAKKENVQIDPDLITEYLSQSDQTGRDAVMEKIYQNVADQVPSTWQDKWNAWRYLSMLGNPRTHIRNVVGNAGFQPVRFVKDRVAAAIESGLEKAGVSMERTKSFGLSPELYRAAWNDYTNVADALGGNKAEDVRSEISDRRRIFENKLLETARKKNTDALSAEDAVFKRVTYADALAGYLKANGVSAEQLANGTADAALLQRARDYAGQEAMRATYNDRNAFSDRAVKVGRDLGVFGEAVLPFKRTPANILARGVEYSPIGAMKSIYDGLTKVKSGEMSAAQVVDEAASGLTGSALLWLGAELFAKGLVTGAGGDDKEDKWNDLLGHQNYALELPDGTSVTLDWLAPEALPFFMGVELASSMGENGFTANGIWNALISAANPMLDMSMLQSLNDLIDNVKYAKGATLANVIASAIVSYFTQAVPTLLGQMERSGESVRMTTYKDKNSAVPNVFQYAIGKASARVPGWDYEQIPYIDAWGREEQTGDVLSRIINNSLNPAYVSQVDMDKVESELDRLGKATGESTVYPSPAERDFAVGGETKYLTKEEYVKYAKTLGTLRYQYADEAINSRAYRKMSDADKAVCISKLYAYANAKAKQAVSDYEMDKEMAKFAQAEKSGVSPMEYYIFREERDLDGNGYDSKAEAKEYLDGTNFTRKQKADLWEIINKSWAKNNPYR